MWCSLLMHGVAFSDDWQQWEWGESESNQRDREKEREKTNKIIIASAIVIMYICTVAIAIVHKCTILHPLMWVFFCSKCAKCFFAHFTRILSTFFHFAQFCINWCNCSYPHIFWHNLHICHCVIGFHDLRMGTTTNIYKN